MHNDVLTLHLDHEMLAFLRREARRANRRGALVATDEPGLAAAYAELLLRESRRESWMRALCLLKAEGWLGCEIFAAADVWSRHRLDSAEAASEIDSAWAHIPLRRWRRCVAQWRDRPEVARALQLVAHELESEDPDCRSACLAFYDRRSLWARLRRRPRMPYAKLKRLGSSSFVGVRLE